MDGLGASWACCTGGGEAGVRSFRNAKLETAAIARAPATPMMIKRLLDFFSSPATASRVARLARCSILCSARLSSLLGNGIGAITSSATGEVLIGSTLEPNGNATRAVDAVSEGRACTLQAVVGIARDYTRS